MVCFQYSKEFAAWAFHLAYPERTPSIDDLALHEAEIFSAYDVLLERALARRGVVRFPGLKVLLLQLALVSSGGTPDAQVQDAVKYYDSIALELDAAL